MKNTFKCTCGKTLSKANLIVCKCGLQYETKYGMIRLSPVCVNGR